MLVNIHKQIFLFLLLFSHAGYAQEWSLNQCIDSARVYNKNLQMNRNLIAISEQKQKEAKANLMPKLTTNADYRYFTHLPYQLMPMSVFGGQEGQFKEAQFGVPHNINANINIAIPIYSPQLYGAIEKTKINYEISELNYHKMEEQVFFEISNLYYNAQILQKQLNFINKHLDQTEKLLQATQLLREQSMAKKTDVTNVELQITQLKTQRNVTENKIEQIMNALKNTMGLPLEYELHIEKEIIKHEAINYVRRTSLDHLIVRKQNKFINNELKILKMSSLPSVSIFGTYGTTGFGYDQSPNRFLNFYPIGFAGFQLSYPLFNGTVTQRKINQKNLELANNQLQLSLVDDQNLMKIENAKLQRKITLSSIAVIEQQINLAESVYKQTIIQNKQGIASLTDVFMADNAVREAQQAYISSIVEYLKADLVLKKLTGNF
jgi:outer membrane protein TolC